MKLMMKVFLYRKQGSDVKQNRYCLKLNIKLKSIDNKTVVIFDNNFYVMQKIRIKLCLSIPSYS